MDAQKGWDWDVWTERVTNEGVPAMHLMAGIWLCWVLTHGMGPGSGYVSGCNELVV